MLLDRASSSGTITDPSDVDGAPPALLTCSYSRGALLWLYDPISCLCTGTLYCSEDACSLEVDAQ
jgi:hypothetical protein